MIMRILCIARTYTYTHTHSAITQHGIIAQYWFISCAFVGSFDDWWKDSSKDSCSDKEQPSHESHNHCSQVAHERSPHLLISSSVLSNSIILTALYGRIITKDQLYHKLRGKFKYLASKKKCRYGAAKKMRCTWQSPDDDEKQGQIVVVLLRCNLFRCCISWHIPQCTAWCLYCIITHTWLTIWTVGRGCVLNVIGGFSVYWGGA